MLKSWRGIGLAMLASLVFLVSAASAGTGALTLISTNATGAKADEFAYFLGGSDNGSKVLLQSYATNLVLSAVPPGLLELYVKDVASGSVVLASSDSAGNPSNGGNYQGAVISRNGRYVAFASNATNLIPADPDPGLDVYVKDLATGSITLATTNSTGAKGNNTTAAVTGISDDGAKVLMGANASNFDPRITACTINRPPPQPPVNCTGREIYLKDMTTGTVTLLTSLTGNGNRHDGGGSGASFGDLSADGNTVLFNTGDSLVPQDTDTVADIYAYSVPTAIYRLVSTSQPVGTSDATGTGSWPKVSANGRRVVFTGYPDAFPGFNAPLYLKDLDTDALTLVSSSSAGVMANDTAQGWISGDGQFASFWSYATNLDPADTDPIGDIYLKNLNTGELTLVSQTDAGIKGNDQSNSYTLPVDGGGAVLFTTASSNLDPADTDGNPDVYRKLFAPSNPDLNGDGIVDPLQPAGTPTGSFVDNTTTPATTGSIANAAGLAVTITDAPDLIDGVLITVGPGAGTQRATIFACGMTHRIYHDSVAVITCGSSIVKTQSGLVEIELDGGLTIVSIPAGATAEVSDTANGASVANVVGGNVTVTVDGVSSVVAPGSPPRALNSWNFTGFDSPVDNSAPPTTIVLNSAKAGRAIPLKWHLANASGAAVTTLTNAVITVENFQCGLASTTDEIEQTAAGESGLQNLGGGNYQLNWKSNTAWAGSCKLMHLDFGDSIKHDAYFKFTK